MRKLDLLIIKSFLGPFVLTTALSTFILLIQHMLKYFEDFVGKDLGFWVFAKLLFYFSLNMLQIALPLGVLVSSLMTFGKLGENFELTALKSSGISLVRVLRPVFFFVLVISIGAFFFNDRVLPIANLKAYTLLYDIRHKKPTLDIQEGVIYRGIPNYVIQARKKFSDDKTLKDVIIWDHSISNGNRRVVNADSCRMYTMSSDRYLKFELYNGYHHSEDKVKGKKIDQFQVTKFARMDMVFDLSSFEFDVTDETLFHGNRQMMNIAELDIEIDSMAAELERKKLNSFSGATRFYSYKKKILKTKADNPVDLKKNNEKTLTKNSQASKKSSNSEIRKINSLDTMKLYDLEALIIEKHRDQKAIVTSALQQARNVKNTLAGSAKNVARMSATMNKFKLEKYKKYSQAFACLVMFLIGAPLGAIIKKGGLGVPIIVAIFFFIVYYVLSISGEEYAKADVMDGRNAVWIANLVLFPIGLFFLRQARIDARVFDKDIYIIWIDRIIEKYGLRKKLLNN